MYRIGQFQRRSSRISTGMGHKMTSFLGIFLFMCALVSTVCCRSTNFDENTNATNEEEHQNGDYQEQRQRDDAEFDWQLSTDNVDFYKILHRLDLEEIITFLENDKRVSDVGDGAQTSITRRQKRSSIFGDDDRRQVSTSMDAEDMPYAATVSISTGCTGTLIGPKHVLTAAHCAYKGASGRTRTKLKVGFLRVSGKTRWRKVRKVYAAREWHTLNKHQNRMRYDYAVLELRREHKRQYMTPTAFHTSQGSMLQFNGFPGDKKVNTMWYTRCFVLRQWHGYLINRCDVAKGMSGSGSYLLVKNKNYVVRGIVIASVKLYKGKKAYKFNVVNPLTRQKTKRICTWMKAGRNCRSFK